MKFMNFKVALMCASLALFAVACDDDDDEDDVTTTDEEMLDDDDAAVDDETAATVTITFEAAELNESGYLNSSAYTESGYSFNNSYYADYDSWSGFAISNNVDQTTAGYLNQYSVYATSGAESSAKFAVAYYSEGYFTPTITREDGATFTPYSASFCLTTYTYLSILNGDDYSTAFAEGDEYVIYVTGYDADGQQVGQVEIYGAEFTSVSNSVLDTWTEQDLSSIGEVSSLAITMTSTDTTTYDGETYYMNTPAYIAIDNLVVSE